MIIVILLISLVALGIGSWADREYDSSFGEGVGFLGAFGTVASLIALICLSISVSNLKFIDQKIDMYQTENAYIEEQVAGCIKQYQEYEKDIIADVSSENALSVITLYPELKSDTLVSAQIEMYISNNQAIKVLKEKKIDGEVKRWWLYFGGDTD